MTHWTRLIPAGVALTAVLGLAACTGEPETAQPLPEDTAPVIQLGAPGEPNRTLSPEEVAELEYPGHIEADVNFIRDMMHHHSQALEMTAIVAERSEDEDIRLFAERMEIGQTDEMARMETWLQDRSEPARDPDQKHGEHAANMPGLLTPQEMEELRTAPVSEFDRLFLEGMIKHHQGALTMVYELFDNDGGQEHEIGVLAREIEADQDIEIKRMQQMLAERE